MMQTGKYNNMKREGVGVGVETGPNKTQIAIQGGGTR